MLEIKREYVARKGRQLQGPISYIPLSPGIFPTPSPYLFPHSHWVTPTLPITVGQCHPICRMLPIAAGHGM